MLGMCQKMVGCTRGGQRCSACHKRARPRPPARPPAGYPQMYTTCCSRCAPSPQDLDELCDAHDIQVALPGEYSPDASDASDASQGDSDEEEGDDEEEGE